MKIKPEMWTRNILVHFESHPHCKKSPFNFVNHPDQPWRRSTFFECCCGDLHLPEMLGIKIKKHTDNTICHEKIFNNLPCISVKN